MAAAAPMAPAKQTEADPFDEAGLSDGVISPHNRRRPDFVKTGKKLTLYSKMPQFRLGNIRPEVRDNTQRDHKGRAAILKGEKSLQFVNFRCTVDEGLLPLLRETPGYGFEFIAGPDLYKAHEAAKDVDVDIAPGVRFGSAQAHIILTAIEKASALTDTPIKSTTIIGEIIKAANSK